MIHQSIRCATLLGLWLAAWPAAAQPPAAHFRHHAQMPPGQIGAAQLERGGPLRGYFQPVEVRGPQGIAIALAQAGTFTDPLPAPLHVGMLIAPVYRLRVTGIPNFEGREVFPTIEVIDRLYPPAGFELRFPIPIDLTEEDLRLAAAGHYVTRVVYVEDPDQALPAPQSGTQIQWFDAGPGNDPLVEADRLGRPVAIVRLGGRVPLDSASPDDAFLHGSPPWELLPPADAVVPAGEDVATGGSRGAEDTPPRPRSSPQHSLTSAPSDRRPARRRGAGFSRPEAPSP